MPRRSPSRFTAGDILQCEQCGKNTIRRGSTQRYCMSCSAQRDRERKTEWNAKHGKPASKTQIRERYERKQSRVIQYGAEVSKQNRAAATWIGDETLEPAPTRIIRFAVPYDRRFSKNALWSTSSQGHVFMRQEIKTTRDALIWKVREATGTQPWYEGKIWVDIFVEKPNARSDAINVIDLVCDSVKKGIGVDDRWFCIRRLDWSIVKDNPRVWVGISQEVEEHHRCCSYCGRILPLAASFTRSSTGYLGYGRECRECTSGARVRAPRELPVEFHQLALTEDNS